MCACTLTWTFISQMAAEHFGTAVDAIFANWPGLQLVINQNSLGQPKQVVAQWLVDSTVQWFSENKDLEQYEVEEFLDAVIDKEFNCLMQDGSSRDTAAMLCEFYTLCFSSRTSDEDIRTKLRALPKCDLSKCQVQVDDDDDGGVVDAPSPHPTQQNGDTARGHNSGHQDMDVEDVASAETTDPDGWTTVTSKGRKNKKN